MQEAKTEVCISPNINHLPDFVRSDYGISHWLCQLCGEWFYEIEDCQL